MQILLVLGKNRISNLDSEAKQSSKIFKLIKLEDLVGLLSAMKMINQNNFYISTL